MRDIQKALQKDTIEEFLHELFNQVHTEKEFIINKKGTTQEKMFGCYITLDKLKGKEYDNMHQFFKLFYTSATKVVKLFGDTNESDHEGREQMIRYFLYNGMLNAFIFKNDKLEEKLRVKDMQDVRRIVNNKTLSRKMCNYIITYVENQCKAYMGSGENPDFYRVGDKLVPVYYNYLDKDKKLQDDLSAYFDKNDTYIDESFKYEDDLEGEIEEHERKSGDFTMFMLENIDLDKSETEFVHSFLMYEKRENGNIYDLDNNLLYSRQNANYYYKKLRKKMLKFIEENDDVYFDEVHKRYKIK